MRLPREILGELKADARRSRIRVNGVVEQTKAMVLAQGSYCCADFRNIPQIERNPQRIERRAPDYRSAKCGQ